MVAAVGVACTIFQILSIPRVGPAAESSSAMASSVLAVYLIVRLDPTAPGPLGAVWLGQPACWCIGAVGGYLRRDSRALAGSIGGSPERRALLLKTQRRHIARDPTRQSSSSGGRPVSWEFACAVAAPTRGSRLLTFSDKTIKRPCGAGRRGGRRVVRLMKKMPRHQRARLAAANLS
jgi:hypothetical protein